MADIARTGDQPDQGLTAASTIFALSSGQPPAGIAVVRISGPDAGGALTLLTRQPLPTSRHAAVSALRARDGRILDRALTLWMPGPGSATGEDIAELHLHGGRAVVAAVIAELAALPRLRPAEPGEFTRRAFENGRIDYTGAEALGDLLRADTEAERRNAIAQMEGGLARLVGLWQAGLIDLSARIEAVVDYSDEDGVDESILSLVMADAADVRKAINDALAMPPAERLHDGFRIVVAGRPNAGKSSLINALSNRDAAIVSPEAGTTRDVIEIPLIWDGIGVILTDTAGLRDDPDNSVEEIGISRARAVAAVADIVLGLDDSVADGDNVLRIRAKADLGGTGSALAVSARTGEGLTALKAELTARMRDMLPPPDSIAINARHRAALHESLVALDELENEIDIVLQAECLRVARLALDKVTGRGNTEAMLDALFARFCIGK